MGDAGEDFDPQREKLSSGCWIRLSARSLPVLSITAHRRRRREAVGTAANAAEAAYQSRYIGKGPPASPPTGAHHSGPVGVAGLRQLHRSRANGEPWERKACRASPYTTRHRPVRAEGTRLRPACHASQSIGAGRPLLRLANARHVGFGTCPRQSTRVAAGASRHTHLHITLSLTHCGELSRFRTGSQRSLNANDGRCRGRL